ncbi:alpha/beta fold hydrolase [Halorussus salinisoli]|uniref:alpha/beta fold hydrolase n=1 Tax=Halorussus salinisoli TaxID=2558242 RepID=UPI0010C17712|nr:alpha/beta hydrolase [Halorussus salinisoli]
MTNALSERASGESSDDAGTRTVSVDEGRSVSYAEYGIPDGRPVVFLHGTPGSRVLGRLFDECARRNGTRLLAPDRPGYGKSSPWPDRTPTDTGEFVAAMLDDAGVSRARVVGFSGGGAFALALAATRGELVSEIDVVSGATPPSLSNDTPRVQRLLGLFARTTPRLLRGLFRGQTWLAERAPPSVVVSQYATEDGRAEIPDEVAELVKRDFVAGFERRRSGAVTELRLLAREWDFSLAEIDHPVRLWHGGRDANVPVDDARRVAERLPNGELTVFEDADHLTTLLRSRSRILERRVSDDER